MELYTGLDDVDWGLVMALRGRRERNGGGGWHRIGGGATGAMPSDGGGKSHSGGTGQGELSERARRRDRVRRRVKDEERRG